ncbi:tyrosine-type recombinase/integrase [Planomonospora sp. ID91781]|uniref:tyrosine-type recombinase/integrase n=1 Tax=Planomonospora sp. ID91781 TaxID=2738135 RepID=UPI0018C3C569|nr:tyrosine-type recombinase/integrase [Planomonospora sp. ID91781]MBG0823322.1 tyrosine-type recombinase/integrase [Planomonospora sp. ID91781]
MAIAVVKDLRDKRLPTTDEELAAFETDLLAGFVLARAAAGIADVTIRQNVIDLEQIRSWLNRPLWEMQPSDADEYFGKVLRKAAPLTRHSKSGSLSMFFAFLDLRYRAEIYALSGHVAQCPIDDMNRPKGSPQVHIRVPPSPQEIDTLFTGWADDLTTCRKFAPAARNYTAAQLMAQVGLRIRECVKLDLDDVRWDLGTFGKLNVRHGKGRRGQGPKQRIVPLINGARRTLQWFVEDVWAHFDDDWTQPGAPLFASERKSRDGSCQRVGPDALRSGLHEAVERFLPNWRGRLTPHVLRHYCASQLYGSGMDLLAVQELLGHDWVATTMRYVHVQRTHIEDAWLQGQQRAAQRLKGLAP